MPHRHGTLPDSGSSASSHDAACRSSPKCRREFRSSPAAQEMARPLTSSDFVALTTWDHHETVQRPHQASERTAVPAAGADRCDRWAGQGPRERACACAASIKTPRGKNEQGPDSHLILRQPVTGAIQRRATAQARACRRHRSPATGRSALRWPMQRCLPPCRPVKDASAIGSCPLHR